MEKENWNVKFLKEQEWKSNSVNDSAWTIIGQANTIFTSRSGLVRFNMLLRSHYMTILGVVLDPKKKPSVVNNKIMFVTTQRQLSSLFGYEQQKMIRVWKEIVNSGLVEIKSKSTVKGVPSEYYLVCPATLVINQLGLNNKNIKEDKQSEVIDFW